VTLKIWHDDIRPAPPGWVWARTNHEAQILLETGSVEEISLDHDLGLQDLSEEQVETEPELLFGRRISPNGSGLDLVNWMCEKNLVPTRVTIHSWNPVGAQNMAARLNYFGHRCVIQPFKA
jgi:NAD+-processing family protein with receiver domain